MKAAEILRKLADMIDQHSDQTGPVNTVPHAELEPVAVDNTEGGEASTMVPPLQQKLELLKKATGVDSHYDEEPCDSAEDAELALIKQRAGVVNPAVLHIATDDNDIVG